MAETKEGSGSEMSLKDQGNEFFKSGKYLKAAALYTQAIKLDPSNPTLYRYPFFLQNFHLFFIWVSLFTSFSWWVSNFASAFCFSVFSLVCFSVAYHVLFMVSCMFEQCEVKGFVAMVRTVMIVTQVPLY